MSQRLRTHIDTFKREYGDTKDGADWCVKALHPSDPATEIRGIPDQTAVPTLLMNYQTTATISPNVAATGTWNFDSVLLPHPLQFMHITQYDSVTPAGVDVDLLNTQIDGATHADKWTSFAALAQRWRLAYMSVTVYQDGPDLANQGTIVVAQAPVNGKKTFVSYIPGSTYSSVQVLSYTSEDLPSFTSTQSMPNAYFNRSREGAYVPLKLTDTTQDWFSQEDATAVASSLTNPVGKSAWMNIPIIDTPAYPFTGLQPLFINQFGYFGEATSPLLQSNWAYICARNLSVQTSYSFYIRCGIEMMVSPSSSLAPQLKLSPSYDAKALETYFAIARELKDAYPADYNDLGKIWKVISSAVKRVAPMVKMIPVPGVAQLAGAAEGVAQAGDAIRAARKVRRARTQKKKVPVTPRVIQPTNLRDK